MNDHRHARALAAWDHLQTTRELAREHLVGPLDELTGNMGERVAFAGRDVADPLVPARLVEGNIGAALCGQVLSLGAEESGGIADADRVAAAARRLLAGAGGSVAGSVRLEQHRSLRRPDAPPITYYRRLTCCLRDRVGVHPCDTCSLRPDSDLTELVDRRLRERLGARRGPAGDTAGTEGTGTEGTGTEET